MARWEAKENQVGFLFGLARDSRLQEIIGKQMHEAKLGHTATGSRSSHIRRATGAEEACPKSNSGAEKVSSRMRWTVSRTTSCRESTLQARSASPPRCKNQPQRSRG